MFTFIGFVLFFLTGYAVGMMIENGHHKQQQMARAKKRHPVNQVFPNIEQEMARDGWKI